MRGWHLGKKLCFIGLIIAAGLTGCSNQAGENGSHIYTEKNMNHFVSEKKAIKDISSVNINCSYADIEVIASDGFYLEYDFYYVTEEPELTIEDGALHFDDTGMNQGSYSISQKESNYIKLYIPTSVKFDELNLYTSSGDISAGSFMANAMTIENSYGDVILTHAMIKDGTIKLSSGILKVEDVGAENLRLENSYGDINVANLNQGDYTMKADHTSFTVDMSSGTLNASKLSFDTLQCTNAYGDVTLSTVYAGKIEGTLNSGDLIMNDIIADSLTMDNSYGDVTLLMSAEEKDYNLNIHSAFGTITIGSKKYEGNVKVDHEAGKDIELTASSGDISINFK